MGDHLKPERCCNIGAIDEPERLGAVICARSQILTGDVSTGKQMLTDLSKREQDILRQCLTRRLAGTCLEQAAAPGPDYIMLSSAETA